MENKKNKTIRLLTMAVSALTLVMITLSSASAATKTLKTVDGIKASIIVSTKKVDIYIKDVETEEVIKDAKVKATILHPGGEVEEITLMGMKMGKIYSYMNSADLSHKGPHKLTFEIKKGTDTVTMEVVTEL